MLFGLSALVVEGLKVHYRLRKWLVMEGPEMLTQIQRNVIYILIMICLCSSLELWMLDSAPALVVITICLKPLLVLLEFSTRSPHEALS